MAAPQGAGISPDLYENIRKLKESSERLEIVTKRLANLSYILIVETLALVMLTAVLILR
jgi:hypothetical protein